MPTNRRDIYCMKQPRRTKRVVLRTSFAFKTRTNQTHEGPHIVSHDAFFPSKYLTRVPTDCTRRKTPSINKDSVLGQERIIETTGQSDKQKTLLTHYPLHSTKLWRMILRPDVGPQGEVNPQMIAALFEEHPSDIICDTVEQNAARVLLHIKMPVEDISLEPQGLKAFIPVQHSGYGDDNIANDAEPDMSRFILAKTMVHSLLLLFPFDMVSIVTSKLWRDNQGCSLNVYASLLASFTFLTHPAKRGPISTFDLWTHGSIPLKEETESIVELRRYALDFNTPPNVESQSRHAISLERLA